MYNRCEIAKPDRTMVYLDVHPAKNDEKLPEKEDEKRKVIKCVNIEGPEFIQDLTYFLVDMNEDIRALETGIPLIMN